MFRIKLKANWSLLSLTRTNLKQRPKHGIYRIGIRGIDPKEKNGKLRKPAKSRPDPGKTKRRGCKSRSKIEKENNNQRNRNRKKSEKLK